VLADVDISGMEETLSLLAPEVRASLNAATFLDRATSKSWPMLPIGRLGNALFSSIMLAWVPRDSMDGDA
jgi:hypothetical protein